MCIRDRHISMMIDNRVSRSVVACRKIVFRYREADAIGKSLTEGASRRLHTRRPSALRMSRSLAAPLSELFDLFQRQIVARQVKQAVEQHRTVSGRQDKPIPVEPMWIVRIVFQKPRPQHKSHRRSAHWQAGMAAVGLA